MPIFNARFYVAELQTEKYQQQLEIALEVFMKKAAVAFVRIAAAAVPFRTGFARGVFRNILQAAGVRSGARGTRDPLSGIIIDYLTQLQQANEEIGRSRPNLAAFLKPSSASSIRRAGREFRNKGRGIRLEYYRAGGRRVLKTPQSGRQFASKEHDIFKIDGKAGLITFNFEVFITYFNFLDFFAHPRVRSAPWKSFFFGRAFFFKSMQDSLKKGLPSVGDFLVEHEVNVTGETKSKRRLLVLGRRTKLV